MREVMGGEGRLSGGRMCELAWVRRAGFYRRFRQECPVEEEMMVRAAVQKVALEHRRRYGYRRIARELAHQGLVVNHKRGLRLLREDNLLGLQPRQFVVTTDSNHTLEVALNYARRPPVRWLDPVWGGDVS